MLRILIIDDDPTLRLILQKALQKQNYDIVVAIDGEEGIAQAKKTHPSLIICDWMMPGIDGLEVCRQIKADPDLSTTFFILLTARGALEDRVRGLDTGADDFLAKPIEISELLARVRAGLRLHQVNLDLHNQKRILETELAEAAAYVRSLLPLPLRSETISIDARFIPSRQLGGDCFDYYWLDPDYLMMYLLDVSGHGLGAALPSISVLNLLRSQALTDVNFYQPNDVLKALNETFQMDRQNEKYFTIWYGVYNRVKRQLTYSTAGHPPAVLISHSMSDTTQVTQLTTPGLPIGMLTEVAFTNERHEVPPASSLYIFSDGIYDFDRATAMGWGLDAFIDFLAQPNPTQDLDNILKTIQTLNHIDLFDDDLSLLRVKFN
jgi:sigma-B regulation protein RsbU (phosphoserine phosphatase)